MLNNLQWLRRCGHKLDPQLRRHIFNLHRPPRGLPCVLHRQAVEIKKSTLWLPVIVQMKTEEYGTTRQNGQWESWVRRMEGRLKRHLPLVDGFAGYLPVEAIARLANSDGVVRIHSDYQVSALLDVASPSVLADRVWAEGFCGRGVAVAIVDTGIYPHQDLVHQTQRLVGFADLLNNRRKPYDDNGHGTHCAGDVGGDGYLSGGKYRGPANEVSLVGVKVLNKYGMGMASTIIAGVQWCLENKEKYGIRIISMSLGGAALGSYRHDPICQAVGKAWDAGIVVCVAAGNDGPNTGTISSPGISPQVITVGAMNDMRTVSRADDRIASFSSCGPTIDGLHKPDLVSPGVGVISLRSPGSYLDKMLRANRVDAAYISMSGTSMATPLVAGLAALILEKNPGFTPEQVKTTLTDTAQKRGLGVDVEGKGYVDGLAAIGQVPFPVAGPTGVEEDSADGAGEVALT